MILRDVINAKMVEIAGATAELEYLEQLALVLGSDCEVVQGYTGSNLKEKCKKCGMAQYMPALDLFQCLATAVDECFPVTQSMSFPDGEVEGEEPDPLNYEEPDIPEYLEYEGLYGSSEIDDCRSDIEDPW